MRKSPAPSTDTDPDQRWARIRWLGCALLLATELDLVARISPEARWLIYRTINVPVIKLIVLAVFIGVAMVLSTKRFPQLPERPRFWRALCGHLVCALALAVLFEPLLNLSLGSPPWVGFLSWLALGACFGLSWLNCLAPSSQWPLYCRRFGGLFLLAYLLRIATDLIWRSVKTELREVTMDLTCGILRTLGHSPIIEHSTAQMGLPGFVVEVGHFCTGLEGVALIIIFLALYLVIRKDDLTFPSAFLLLPVAAVLSWLLNGVRLACLVLLGTYVSPALALEGFHSRAGWVSFVCLAFFFVIVIERGQILHKVKMDSAELPAVPYLAPLGLQLFLTLLSAAFSHDIDVFYPARIVLVIAVLLFFRRVYEESQLWSAPDLRAIPLGLLVYGLWIGLIPATAAADPRDQMPVTFGLLWIAARLVGSGFVVPVVEELAFRGYLLRRLQGYDFQSVSQRSLTVSSVVISSLAFGLLHQAWFAATLAGIVYAFTAALRGKLVDAIVAHCVTNLCIAVHVVVLSRWDLWI